MRAFAYLRVSGQSQVTGDGFSRQISAIKGYAELHDLRIAKVFREEAVSGRVEGMDRPTWAAMIATAVASGIKTIVVEGLGRLARELMVQEYIIRDMAERGITLISVHEPDLHSSDATRIMFRQIVGAIHQYERTMIVLKLRGARQRMKAKHGRCEGAKTYGHYPGEDVVLERMRALRASKMGFDAIASTLNSEGVAPRRGSVWHGSSVNKILTRQTVQK